MFNLFSIAGGVFGLIKGGVSVVGTVAGGPLAWLGGLWSLISTLWATEIGRLLISCGAVFLIAWTLGWNHEHSVKVQALAARDTQWEQQIATANAASEQRINLALAAAQSVKPAPENRADLLALCKADASCRKALKK
jgi:hypothetical protein